MIPQEVIRAKRNGETLPPAVIYDFVSALSRNEISEGQVAAFAMAVWFSGMTAEETVALTLAMRDSGDVMSWPDLDRPVGDKHSTGGVGDNVSLMLAPIAAACGLAVPMISGRGLGHTGGTLDKLESIPGYDIFPSKERFSEIVRGVGCAIIGQTGEIAPADKRLYAIRDVTATVDSVPLITGSILSKKLAAGLQSLVMDVKTGNGAFMQSLEEAETLARSIVDVANGAGVKTTALITDMNEPLADCAGNAVEVAHAMEFLEGGKAGTRIHAAVMAFAAEMLVNAGLAADLGEGERRAAEALASGRAMEVFGRMVHAQGGPVDFTSCWRDQLPKAPVIRPVPAPRSGFVAGFHTRDVGLAVIGLGGGRIRPEDMIDHRTGFTAIIPVGGEVSAGEPLAFVHAADEDTAAAAIAAYVDCATIADAAEAQPVVYKRIS
ncbi:thymidine phosphorylase [Rhizobium sp. SG_E_25_P2]|uniref:thymidine phosphorylase n=1 Tax=Rhizobium sp. SG_E_25_P2 TaxID=2879942 RepID=UPI00247357E6|nr:thymidine phosphorylase [Rhizobium sp. SG_E_25_P2]MDH6265340.1 thymidine phosphorylase [Rhizobium sp. SG_E_25_P2]